MTDVFLQLFFFLRPPLSINVRTPVMGIDLFDILTISLTSLLGAIWVGKLLLRRAQRVSGIDLAIIAFCLWCSLVSVLYIDKVVLRDVVKYIIPPLTYVFVKSLLTNAEHYRRCLFSLIVGFAFPALLSAYAIGADLTLAHAEDNPYTGVARYRGAFINSHNFGHSMTLLLMLTVAYWAMYRRENPRVHRTWTWWESSILVVVSGVGLYCLYYSFVRTAYVGLISYIVLLTYFLHKRLLIILLLAGAVGLLAMTPRLGVIFYDIAAVSSGERELERVASSRPYIWRHNLERFSNLSLDRQLAGAGIGNRVQVLTFEAGTDNIWNSHNDFLDVLLQTGIIGLVLFLLIQVAIARRILTLEGRERHVFLAMFLAVMLMDMASNSYVQRFSIGQIFYMVLAYIESAAVVRKGLSTDTAPAVSEARLGVRSSVGTSG